MISFGTTLAAYRTAAKETQEELGALLNLSDKTISRWESGATEPDFETLIKIAEHYSITVDTLLGCGKSDTSLIAAMREALSSTEDIGEMFSKYFALSADLTRAGSEAYRQMAYPADEPNSVIPSRAINFGDCDRVALRTASPAAYLMAINAREVNMAFSLFQNESNFAWVRDKADDLAKLFALLGDADTMKILYLLSRQDCPRRITAKHAAKLSGVPAEKAEQILDALCTWSSFSKQAAELVDGPVTLYDTFDGQGLLLALLSIANLYIYDVDVNLYANNGRTQMITVNSECGMRNAELTK